MLSSGAPSKSRKPGWLVWVLLAAVILAGLALSLGPTILLKAALARLLPAESGLTLEYTTAQAGFLPGWAEITGLTIGDRKGDGAPPLLALKRLRLDGLRPGSLLRSAANSWFPEPAFEADEVLAEGLTIRHRQLSADLETAYLRRPHWPPHQGPPEDGLSFDQLEARGLNISSRQGSLGFSRLEARDLGPEFLAALSLRDFHFEYAPGPDGRDKFQLEALSLAGLRLEAIRRLSAGPVWWGLLAGCDDLNLVRGRLTRSGSEALTVRAVNFDSVSRPTGATGFRRRLELSVDLKALSADSREPFWTDLRDIAGDRFQADLNLELDYDPGSKRAELKNTRLIVPQLGRLELTGALGGVEAVKSHHSPSQLLLSARGWSLEKMGLLFEDQGLAANFYRHLGHTVFGGAPSGQSGANIINYVVAPLARDLEYEQGLDNLPALVSEAEAFLERPLSLWLRAEPAPPLPLLPVINSISFMSFANQGKYDIIEKLRLTLVVNGRAPIFVTVASGVFKENLPLAPRPLENAFDEETLEFPEDI